MKSTIWNVYEPFDRERVNQRNLNLFQTEQLFLRALCYNVYRREIHANEKLSYIISILGK